jgi:hypothetical protein
MAAKFDFLISRLQYRLGTLKVVSCRDFNVKLDSYVIQCGTHPSNVKIFARVLSSTLSIPTLSIGIKCSCTECHIIFILLSEIRLCVVTPLNIGDNLELG